MFQSLLKPQSLTRNEAIDCDYNKRQNGHRPKEKDKYACFELIAIQMLSSIEGDPDAVAEDG